jgi:molybdate transport system substrate-binding protein
VALLSLVGCSGGGDPTVAPSRSNTVTVFAAASLNGAFATIAKDFQAANPNLKVTLNFGDSTALAVQIKQGAPADVFASASPADMQTVVDSGNADGPTTTFARNQLVIAVPKGNPKRIKALSDLAKLKVALCAEQLPCGAAARKALDAAKVKFTPATLEQDVKTALSKVKGGEVDAALVYRTEATDVDTVALPDTVSDYPIVVLINAPNKAGGRAFVAYVLSDKGKAVLTAAGFQSP